MKTVRVAADRWNVETSDGTLITPLGGTRSTTSYTCRGYQARMWDKVHALVQAGQVPESRFV